MSRTRTTSWAGTLSLVGRQVEAPEELRRTEELPRGFFLVQTEIHAGLWLTEGRQDLDRSAVATTERAGGRSPSLRREPPGG